ncbi:MAG: hypothetical protein GY943_04885 [Chloroflexi bacterium]|nr:hypothetical protein [Chloroflexota bacterium]
MMFEVEPSRTDRLCLDDVTVQLSLHEAVHGIVWIGSTGTDKQTKDSDYDLLLFVSPMSVPLHVIFTTIDGVLTDVVFAELPVLDRIMAADDLSALSVKDGALMHWLANGRIQHDRNGRLTQAQTRLNQEQWQDTLPAAELRKQWQKVNYNWLQTKRMLAANDPVYETAVSMRLHYMIAELYIAYFHVRQMGWQGEKTAVRYWQAQDPDFLALFMQYQATSDCVTRFSLYEKLAQHTLASVGGLWDQPATSASLAHPTENDEAAMQASISLWHNLLNLEI